MTRWEYLTIICDGEAAVSWVRWVNGREQKNWKRGPTLEEYLAARGQEGWELVAVNHYAFYFKRAIE